MPANDLIEDTLRAQLTAVVSDVTPTANLAETIRRRYRRRMLRRAGVAAVAVVGLIAGAVVVDAQTDGTHGQAQATIDLAGYSVSLPPGVHASSLRFTSPHASSTNPPSTSPLVQCRSTGAGALMNSPAAWGPPPYKQPALSNFVVTSPSSNGCVSGLITLPYGTGTAPIPDAVAPIGAQSVEIDAYPTMELVSGSPTVSDYAYYVQLPASGGGFQDLIVAAMGLPQNEVVRLVQQVVAGYEGHTIPAVGAHSTTATSG